MQKRFSIIISSLVIITSLIVPSVISLQYASSIVTEEDLAKRTIDKISNEAKEVAELNWKNYTNSELGFSIEYPEPFDSPQILPDNFGAHTFIFSNYKTVENSFLPSFTATMDVYLADSYEKTLRQFMSEDYSGSVLIKPMPQPTEISIAGNTTGLEYNAKDVLGEPNKFVGFVHGKYIYVLGSDDVDSKNRQTLYDHMLNSIKFVNVIDSDDDNDQIDSNNSNFEDNEDSDERDNDNEDDNNDNN